MCLWDFFPQPLVSLWNIRFLWKGICISCWIPPRIVWQFSLRMVYLKFSVNNWLTYERLLTKSQIKVTSEFIHMLSRCTSFAWRSVLHERFCVHCEMHMGLYSTAAEQWKKFIWLENKDWCDSNKQGPVWASEHFFSWQKKCSHSFWKLESNTHPPVTNEW